MYVLGAHIVSKYSGKPYTTFVKERIFSPLNMSSTTFFAQEAMRFQHFSQAFTTHKRRIPYWFEENSAAELIAGAGAILSTTVDMVCMDFLTVHFRVDRHIDEMARIAA